VRKRPRMIVHAPRADLGRGMREIEAHGEMHSLEPLGDAVHRALYWEQPRVFRREWRLVSDRGEHVVLHGQGISRRKLQAETPGAAWTLTRSWTGVVTLADMEGRELATIPHGWLGRWRLAFPSGLSLAWRRHWGGDHVLEDAEGHELLRVRRRFAFFRFQATVEVAESVRLEKNLLELLVVTFFAWLSEPRGHGH
jgi:hypothetical protein